jgi:hypothetical protein
MTAASQHPLPPARGKPLMRSLGEFFGHIVKGLRTNPDPHGRLRETEPTEVSRTVEEETRSGMVLRRTTIEEIEITKPSSSTHATPPSPSHDEA